MRDVELVPFCWAFCLACRVVSVALGLHDMTDALAARAWFNGGRQRNQGLLDPRKKARMSVILTRTAVRKRAEVHICLVASVCLLERLLA